MNNQDKVLAMIEKKVSPIRDRIDEIYPNVAKEPERKRYIEPTTAEKVEESIGNKVAGALVRASGYSGKYAASKYMGKPISELMREEERTRKEVEKIQEDLDKFEESFLEKIYKAVIKVPGYNEERARDYAKREYKLRVVGTYAETEKEKELHTQYLALRDAYTQCKVEYNAVRTAKSAYIEENADLIKEIQEKKRREDLLNSGLLDELGLAEKTEEVKEEVKEEENE